MGTFKGPACLDFEHLVATIVVLIDPSADGIACIGRLDVGGPVAPVGEDPTKVVFATDQNIGGFRRDDVFVLPECHHARHPARQTPGGGIIAQSTLGLIRHAVLQDLLILRCQRGLLSGTPRLGRIEGRLASHPRHDDASPLAFPVGVLRVIKGLRTVCA